MAFGTIMFRDVKSLLDFNVHYYLYYVIGVLVAIIILLTVLNYLLRSKITRLSSRLRGPISKHASSIENSLDRSTENKKSVSGSVKTGSDNSSLVHEKGIETLAKLASSLSHDLNNIVGNIMGYASLLKKKLQPDSKEFHYAEIIENSSKQMAELVKHVLGFSHLDTKSVEVVDLGQFVENVTRDFEVLRKGKYDVRVSMASRQIPVKISTLQFKQVIVAIMDNAADSMETGGTIKCSIGLPENSSDCFIEIEDHGTGMDAEIRRKIFEPFFTTKPEKKYTGLSLSQVYVIVKQHGGTIAVDSAPGVGTKFKIYLPVCTEEIVRTSKEKIPETLELKELKILIVDDEENVRQLGFDILTEHGFKVITANDGQDALEKLRENPDIQLAILDMIMPVMTGKEACVEIKKMKNAPKVLICTGFSELSDLKTILGTYAEGLLQKPYSTGELVAAVENILKSSAF
ncbi:MAG TPA: response regulator [Candidatus Acidoferrales bacterium]|nr:response regulator [Candidatus Acidoferrales bacterium]